MLDVLLTVHHYINFIPVTNLMHKFLYSYIVTILYMFRAVICSSSGGQIVFIQHMVSSLCMSGRGGRTVHWLRQSSLSTSVLHDHQDHSFRVTIPYTVYIQFDLLMMSIYCSKHVEGFFYAFSTVHHSIVLFLQPTLVHNSITTCHITILDMFRALTCPSSGGTTAQTQHLVSSLS